MPGDTLLLVPGAGGQGGTGCGASAFGFDGVNSDVYLNGNLVISAEGGKKGSGTQFCGGHNGGVGGGYIVQAGIVGYFIAGNTAPGNPGATGFTLNNGIQYGYGTAGNGNGGGTGQGGSGVIYIEY
ncbi:MAG: hypothetical protein IPH78_10860 [Bacteroidetes bacterium]|nr:hypothetical protein [Bacteroidota bacterium]